MFKRFSLTLLAVVSMAGCATFHSLVGHDPFKNADGSVDVAKILLWAEYGIDADCQIGTSALAQDICTFGHDALAGARAALAKDPAAGRAVVLQSLQDFEARLQPTQRTAVHPYFKWVEDKLAAKS